jgi:hypothetical protein
MSFKVDPMIAATVTMQRAAITLDLLKLFSREGIEILRQYLKLGKKIELEILGQGTHLCCTRGIKDHLKHAFKNSDKLDKKATL